MSDFDKRDFLFTATTREAVVDRWTGAADPRMLGAEVEAAHASALAWLAERVAVLEGGPLGKSGLDLDQHIAELKARKAAIEATFAKTHMSSPSFGELSEEIPELEKRLARLQGERKKRLAAADEALLNPPAPTPKTQKQTGYLRTSDMLALARAVAPVIKRHVADCLAPLAERLAAIEARGIPYKGVWQRAVDYRKGDFVTHTGCMWFCCADTTTKPPSDHWQLAVRSGRDAQP